MMDRISVEAKLYRLVWRFGKAPLPMDFADPLPYLEAILRVCEWNSVHDISLMAVIEPVENSYGAPMDNHVQLERENISPTGEGLLDKPKLCICK